jgi:hypothetical protein
MLYYDDRFWHHLSRHASSPHVEINYDISAFLDDIQTTALLATVLFYGIYHNQLQTRHQRLAILDTAVLHFGDGGDTFTLQLLWGSKCFVLSGYGTSTTHIITLPFGLNPFGIKFIHLFSLEPIVFFETFFAVRTLFPFVQGSVRLFHTSNFNWEGSVLGFPLGFSFRKRMYFFPDGYSLGPCHYWHLFYPLLRQWVARTFCLFSACGAAVPRKASA